MPDLLGERTRNVGGAVPRAIVHHNDLGLAFARANISRDLRERSGKASLFIEGRNDNGELRSGAHRNGNSFPPWAPTSGTNRQGATILVRRVSSVRSISCRSWFSASPTGTIIRSEERRV